MIDKEAVKVFFNERAEKWDEHNECNESIINRIFENAEVNKGKSILDVACGTGVLFEHYLKKGVKSVTAIDISEKMAMLASQKAENTSISVICGDVTKSTFTEKFDIVMVYNALPHFADVEKLTEHLASLLKKGGILCFAHGAGRKKIDEVHRNVPHEVDTSGRKVFQRLRYPQDL